MTDFEYWQHACILALCVGNLVFFTYCMFSLIRRSLVIDDE